MADPKKYFASKEYYEGRQLCEADRSVHGLITMRCPKHHKWFPLLEVKMWGMCL